MPPPKPLSRPPFHTVRLSHAVFDVTDLAAARAFWADMLGFVVSDEADGALFLRAMEARRRRSIVLRQADRAAAGLMSSKIWEEDDLDRTEDCLEATGRATARLERPFQGRTPAATDRHGAPIELHARMARLPSRRKRHARYKGVRPLRIDQFSCVSPHLDESDAFRAAMGFRTTEYAEDAETGRLWAAWMHREGGVHDIAFPNGSGPRLHHTAFRVPTPLNVIDLLDLMATSGSVATIERGPARRGVSNAYFFYVRDAKGLYLRDAHGRRIEINCSDYQTFDPDHEPIHRDLNDPRRQTLWGGRRRRKAGSRTGRFSPASHRVSRT